MHQLVFGSWVRRNIFCNCFCNSCKLSLFSASKSVYPETITFLEVNFLILIEIWISYTITVHTERRYVSDILLYDYWSQEVKKKFIHIDIEFPSHLKLTLKSGVKNKLDSILFDGVNLFLSAFSFFWLWTMTTRSFTNDTYFQEVAAPFGYWFIMFSAAASHTSAKQNRDIENQETNVNHVHEKIFRNE